jgi:exosome complex exonuclease DIS3/RRP44
MLFPSAEAYSQMDLLASVPKNLPLIVPSTVIRETRHRSLPLYNRLQELVKDEDRMIWVWWNEERRETATVGEEGESPNDQNDRGAQYFHPIPPSGYVHV